VATYTLVAMKNGRLKVKVKLTQEFSGDGSANAIDDGSGSGKGTMTLKLSNLLPLRSNAETSSTINVQGITVRNKNVLDMRTVPGQ